MSDSTVIPADFQAWTSHQNGLHLFRVLFFYDTIRSFGLAAVLEALLVIYLITVQCI